MKRRLGMRFTFIKGNKDTAMSYTSAFMVRVITATPQMSMSAGPGSRAVPHEGCTR